MAIVKDALPDAELMEIEQRTARALDVVPTPWNPWLETLGGLGGCSFIQAGDDPAVDNEMYIDVHLGPSQLRSPVAVTCVMVQPAWVIPACGRVPRRSGNRTPRTPERSRCWLSAAP